MQSMMGDVCAASEPLIEQLEPVAAKWIKVELQHLSRDVLLLDRATSRTKEKLKVETLLVLPYFKGKSTEVARPHERLKHLCPQEEREQQQLVQTRLEDVEEQIRSLQTAPENRFRDTNFSKVGHTSDFLQTNVHTLCFCASLS